MKRAIFIAPFDELSEPARVVELAQRAERRGWDGKRTEHGDESAPARWAAGHCHVPAARSRRFTCRARADWDSR